MDQKNKSENAKNTSEVKAEKKDAQESKSSIRNTGKVGNTSREKKEGKGSNNSNKNIDHFYLEKIYSNPFDVFELNDKGINEIKDSAIYIFDTNSLLFLYKILSKKESTNTLDEYKRIYSKLKTEKRLFIPARVAIEFSKNRGREVKRFLTTIKNKRDIASHAYKYFNAPILEGNPNYRKVLELEKNLNKLRKDYLDCLEKLEVDIIQFDWSDPVSTLYSELFTKELIIEVKMGKKELIEKLHFNIKYKNPPGFQDKTKPDEGIGDVIIWQTILEIGLASQNDIVFVTEDGKNDWFHQAEGKTALIKDQLLEEFKRFTNGKNICVINFLDFLKLQEANESTLQAVNETKNQQKFLGEFIVSKNIKDIAKVSWIPISHNKLELGMFVRTNVLGDNGGRIVSKYNTPDNGVLITVEYDDKSVSKMHSHIYDWEIRS